MKVETLGDKERKEKDKTLLDAPEEPLDVVADMLAEAEADNVLRHCE